MWMQIAGRRGCDGKLRWRGLAALLAGSLLGLVSACQPVPGDALQGPDGEIRLEDVFRITGDSGLTPDEQRQALRDLGITDEDLIDMLVRGFSR